MTQYEFLGRDDLLQYIVSPSEIYIVKIGNNSSVGLYTHNATKKARRQFCKAVTYFGGIIHEIDCVHHSAIFSSKELQRPYLHFLIFL